jgi:hypothetical protein
MRPRDRQATTAGILFIVATVGSLVATAVLGSLLDGPGFMAAVAAHQGRMLVAALFQLVAAFTAAGIAIALYPVLSQRAPAMALGSVGYRLIEGVFYTLSALGTLMLVAMSDQLPDGGTSAATGSSADLVRDLRDSAGCVAVLAFYIGATLYYLVFYRSRLIPRWLSAWGLAGTALGFAAGLLVLFRVIGVLSGPQMALNVPIGVQEMVFAVWLIAKGFGQPAPPAAPGDPMVPEFADLGVTR